MTEEKDDNAKKMNIPKMNMPKMNMPVNLNQNTVALNLPNIQPTMHILEQMALKINQLDVPLTVFENITRSLIEPFNKYGNAIAKKMNSIMGPIEQVMTDLAVKIEPFERLAEKYGDFPLKDLMSDEVIAALKEIQESEQSKKQVMDIALKLAKEENFEYVSSIIKGEEYKYQETVEKDKEFVQFRNELKGIPIQWQVICFIFFLKMIYDISKSIAANAIYDKIKPIALNKKMQIGSKKQKIKKIKFDIDVADYSVITRNNTIIREKPSSKSKIYKRLEFGTVLYENEEVDNWVNVSIFNSNEIVGEGWVSKRFIRRLKYAN